MTKTILKDNQVIHNQENCGKKMLCAQFDLCRHFNPKSEPCNYEMGYHSEDCLTSIYINEEIEKDDEKERLDAQK